VLTIPGCVISIIAPAAFAAPVEATFDGDAARFAPALLVTVIAIARAADGALLLLFSGAPCRLLGFVVTFAAAEPDGWEMAGTGMGGSSSCMSSAFAADVRNCAKATSTPFRVQTASQLTILTASRRSRYLGGRSCDSDEHVRCEPKTALCGGRFACKSCSPRVHFQVLYSPPAGFGRRIYRGLRTAPACAPSR
jgi:hypothetical protein